MRRLWVGMFFFFVWVPILVEVPMMPSPYALQICTLSGTDLGQTFMASEQECEEARARTRLEVSERVHRDWLDGPEAKMELLVYELAKQAEGAGCAASSVTDKPE